MIISKVNEIVKVVLEFASRFGRMWDRFVGGSRFADILNKPAEELLHSRSSMIVIVVFFSMLPVLFILNAIIRHIKRIHVGLIMKNKCKTEGVVTDINWKKLTDESYKVSKDRFAKVSYKVKYQEYILRCPAGEVLKGDKVCVVYEKSDPTQSMLERDYEDGMHGRIFELIVAGVGVMILAAIFLALFVVYVL